MHCILFTISAEVGIFCYYVGGVTLVWVLLLLNIQNQKATHTLLSLWLKDKTESWIQTLFQQRHIPGRIPRTVFLIHVVIQIHHPPFKHTAVLSKTSSSVQSFSSQHKLPTSKGTDSFKAFYVRDNFFFNYYVLNVMNI